MAILADALQDAGCEDAAILDHLRTEHRNKPGCHYCDTALAVNVKKEVCTCRRPTHAAGVFPNRNGGCWDGTCWVVQALLDRPQRVVALYSHRGTMDGDFTEAPVINPGDENGKTWCLVPTTWVSGPEYIVEAEYVSDAEDILIDDDDFGKQYRISDDDLKDYITYSGRGGDNSELPDYNCNFTGSGNPYDTADIHVYGTDYEKVPFKCRYFGPGIPCEGVEPPQYGVDAWECVICGKHFYILDDREYQVCSSECSAEHRKIIQEEEAVT